MNYQIIYFLATFILGFIFLGAMFGSLISNGGNLEGNKMPNVFAGIGFTLLFNGLFLIINIAVCIKSALSAQKGEIWNNPLALPMIR